MSLELLNFIFSTVMYCACSYLAMALLTVDCLDSNYSDNFLFKNEKRINLALKLSPIALPLFFIYGSLLELRDWLWKK